MAEEGTVPTNLSLEEGNRYGGDPGEEHKDVHVSSDEEEEVPDEGVGITHSTWQKPAVIPDEAIMLR